MDAAIQANPPLALQFARIMEIREEILAQAKEIAAAGIEGREAQIADPTAAGDLQKTAV